MATQRAPVHTGNDRGAGPETECGLLFDDVTGAIHGVYYRNSGTRTMSVQVTRNGVVQGGVFTVGPGTPDTVRPNVIPAGRLTMTAGPEGWDPPAAFGFSVSVG